MPPAASRQRSSALDTGRGGKDREVDVRLFAVFAFALSPEKQGPFNRQPKWESLAGVHFRAWRELSFPSLPFPKALRAPVPGGGGAQISPCEQERRQGSRDADFLSGKLSIVV